MLSRAFCRKANRLLLDRRSVNLAVFGPGLRRPFYEKRLQAVEAIRSRFSDVQINYDPIDERVPQSSSYEDYPALRKEEIDQIRWADVILILINHHKLTAIAEVSLCREAESASHQCMRKVGIVALGNLQISGITLNEWQWQLGGKPQRIGRFTKADLEACRVAREMLVDMFTTIVVELWGE